MTEVPKSSQEVRRRDVVRSLTWRGHLYYRTIHFLFHFFGVFLLGMRTFGCENVPKTGPVLLVANHQSYLDPPIIGVATSRRLNYLARKTLFKSRWFGAAIRALNAIPLDNEGIGFDGIKETLKRLKNGEAVLLFPEGARSFDGEMSPFRPGFLTLAMRSQATIVPVAVAGMFEAWPRTAKFPKLHRVIVSFGEPLVYETYSQLAETELHKIVENRVARLYDTIR